MTKIKEQDLYKDVAGWLEARLPILYRGWTVKAYDTSRVRLNSFLDRLDLGKEFENSDAFEIEVDITGILKRAKQTKLALVECKVGPISLKDVGQIIGYSRVALPSFSLIVSPGGLSSCMNLLLRTYNRVDLLEYSQGRRLKVGFWDLDRKQVDPESVFPSGEIG